MKENLSIAGFNVLKFHSIDSTNEEAKRLINAGERGSLAIWALAQEAGRGRYGRNWVSAEGNLFVSLIVPVEVDLQKAAQFSFVAALAVGEMLAEIADNRSRVAFKWPNDVLFDGRKVAGILLESSSTIGKNTVEAVVIGIGVNIATSPDDTVFPAISLCDAGVKIEAADSVRECLQKLLEHFTKWREIWEYQGLAPIVGQWLASAKAKGDIITANTGAESYSGVFEGLTETGELILREENGGKRYISSGEIFFGNI